MVKKKIWKPFLFDLTNFTCDSPAKNKKNSCIDYYMFMNNYENK